MRKQILIGIIAVCLAFTGIATVDAKLWARWFSALTGSGTGALDKIDGADLQDGEIAIGNVSGVQYEYYLDVDSGLTEYSPYIIKPDTNAGNKRWVLAKQGPNLYVVNAGATDQGTDSNDFSFADIAATIGTTTKATVKVPHISSGTTTAYPFSTAEDLSSYSNIVWEFEQGAVLVPASGVTIGFASPENIKVGPNQQSFNVSALGSGVTFYYPGRVRPEMYGADNTGTNDSWRSMQAAADAVKGTDILKYLQSGTLLLTSGGVYKMSQTLWLGSGSANTGVRSVSVDGDGAATLLAVHTGIAVDWTGTHYKSMNGVQIYGDDTTTPSIGLLLARRSTGIGGGLTTLRNCMVMGKFTSYGVYNYASEEFFAFNCEFRTNSKNIFFISKTNEAAVTIPNQDGTLAGESCTNFFFDQCSFYSSGTTGTAETVVRMDSTYNVSFSKCQFGSTVARNIPLVHIKEEAAGITPLNINFSDCLWHEKFHSGVSIQGTVSQLSINETNRFVDVLDGAGLVGNAGAKLSNSYIVVPSFDMSQANSDLLYWNVVKITDYTSGFFKLSRYFHGELHAPSTVQVVYSDNEWEGIRYITDTGIMQTYHTDYLDVSTAQTSGTTEAPLMEVSGVSGFLGSRFSIRAAGYFDNANNGLKSVVLYIGTASGVTVIPANNHSDNHEWTVSVDCYQSEANNTTQYCSGSGVTNTSTGTQPTTLWARGVWNPGINITSGNTVAIKGICTNSGDTVYQRYLDVSFK